MPDTNRLLEDTAAILLVFRRLQAVGAKIALSTPAGRATVELLGCDGEAFSTRLEAREIEALKLAVGEKATLALEDRTMKFEGIVHLAARVPLEDIPCGQFAYPRTLRRTDSHRFVSFVPDTDIRCSFSNARGALPDGQIKGLSSEGLELALSNPRQNVQEVFRVGEEATIDFPLEGNQRVTAPTRVAYFGDATVGLEFTNKMQSDLMRTYHTWLETQAQLQAQRDRDELDTGPMTGRTLRPAEMPAVKLLVDNDPLVLVLAEREDLVRRLAEGLGRKFGFGHLNYIKGPVRPLLADLGSEDPSWGRPKLIIVHHQLMVASPLELTRQLVSMEQCPLPVLVAGTEEDAELKANRAIAAGAVGFMSVEPFRILSVLRRLDEIIKLFHGG